MVVGCGKRGYGGPGWDGEAGIEGKSTEVLEVPSVFSYRDDALQSLIDSVRIDDLRVGFFLAGDRAMGMQSRED